MLSLHNTVETLKKLVKWSAILAAGMISLVLLFRIGAAMKNIYFPTAAEPPDVKFGKLPRIAFPESVITDTLTYTIDTLSGELPVFQDRAKVFKIEQPSLTLLNANRAKDKADSLGFTDFSGKVLPHSILSPTVYQWQNDVFGLRRTLTIDIESYGLTLTSTYKTNAGVLNPTYTSDEKRAIDKAAEVLRYGNVDMNDIDFEKTGSLLLKIANNTLVPAPSLSTAHVAQVNFYQKNRDELPIFYPRYPVSTMNFLVSLRALDINDVVEAHINYKKILDESATYPIKTAQEAFQELQDGKGYIANYYGSGTAITITDVFLGYYVGEAKQEYLTPIIIFQGEGDFYGYVSALKNDWLL